MPDEKIIADSLKHYESILIDQTLHQAIEYVYYCINFWSDMIDSYEFKMWSRTLELLHDDLSLNFN